MRQRINMNTQKNSRPKELVKNFVKLKSFCEIWKGHGFVKLMTTSLLALGYASCQSVGPDYQPPDPMLPKSSYFGKPIPKGSLETEDPGNSRLDASLSWRAFHDPILNRLINKAGDINLDVQAATLKLMESRSERDFAAAAALPTLRASPFYQRQLFSENGIISLGNAFLPGNRQLNIPPFDVYQAGFDASWELDIWGHVRRQIESADAQALALVYKRQDTLIATYAELARDYIELRGVQAQMQIANENIKKSSESLDIIKTRSTKGVTPGIDAESAAAELESVKSVIPGLQAQESSLMNAIGLLLDEPPGALKNELSVTKPIPVAPPQPPLGIPSELARRRPDIRKVEAELHAATANIGVAVAEFYPTFKINGPIGLNSLQFYNLWKANSLQYQFGPSVSLPIFDGGRLKSTLELRETQQKEAAISYHKTVLQAWHEVVNSLNDYQSDQNKLRNIKLQIAHNREVLKLARERFDRGVGEFLKVLDADRSLLQAELQYTQSATKTAVDFVRLYKSLGGGWEERFPESEITKQ